MSAEAESIGPYRIDGIVRQHGVLTTYRAKHRVLGREAWITTTAPSVTPSAEVLARLAKSAALLAGVGFDGVLGLIEVIDSDRRFAVVTEAPPGESLRELMEHRAKRGGSSERDGGAVALALSLAVAKLHRHGIVHLRLAPEDAFLDPEGRVKLAGMWEARSVNDEQEARDVPEPGPHERYRSPERFSGTHVGRESDVFSLGVIAYELFSGRHPFEQPGSEASLPRRLRTEDAPPIEGNALLWHALQKSLQKLPSLRYESADRFAEDLALALDAQSSQTDLAGRTPTQSRFAQLQDPLVRKLLLLAGVMGLLMIAAVLSDGRDEIERGHAAGSGSASVRVLARPWADIFVDGQQVDTTPVGRPLRLAPGRHEISFRHPRAPEQRRVIDLAPGANVTLDVEMDITRPVDAGPDGSP